ncbi:hypothetical protein [Nitrosovibrio sp. Nv4]|uniref:hypothetical protein n=1 Tax=Nitrosovibrio sp. Nv4 TaxID=1945880 RepID=UPI000BC66CC7|nr:hypothetical protein [Nitrosovibrio sp. Nv4]SOD42350.1 hypothetical protein SAMN06298226_2689 [Nitrosovibrio sp. Nv4]
MASKSRLGSGGYGIRRRGSFAGKAVDKGIVADAFLSSMAVSTAIKKPGIPVGTAPWLKTLLEILTGRRGNKITVPKFEELTFSTIPTKAECEALYSYVNSVRSSLESLINRFDS